MKTPALTTTCPVGIAISLLSGRWRSSILCTLLDADAVRFSELQRRASAKAGRQIARKVLVEELTALRKMGLVRRTAGMSAKPPLEIHYSLTPWGRELAPVIDALMIWARSPSAKLTAGSKASGDRASASPVEPTASIES